MGGGGKFYPLLLFLQYLRNGIEGKAMVLKEMHSAAAFGNILLETSMPNLVPRTRPSLHIFGKTRTRVFTISGFLVNLL